MLTLAACTAAAPSANLDPRPGPPPLPERPGDPRWRLLPELAGCDVSLAADPTAVGRTLAWDPCPTGQVPGCRVLHDDHPTTLTHVDPYKLSAGWTDAGVMLAIHDPEANPKRPRLTLAPLDGPPLLVFDLSYESCQFHQALFADAAAMVAIFDHRTREQPIVRVLVGPLGPDAAWHSPVAATDVVAPLSFSSTTPLVGVRRPDARTGTFTPVADPSSSACCGYAVGVSTVLVADGQLRVVDPGGASRPLRTAGRIAGLVHVGGAFYWAEGVDPIGEGFKSIELWTAPATADPAAFAARRIAELPLHFLPHQVRDEFGPLVVGGGHIAFYHLERDLPGPRVSIVDIATGARRRFVSREGLIAVGALFVDADEVGIDVIAEQRRTTVRIPLTSVPLL